MTGLNFDKLMKEFGLRFIYWEEYIPYPCINILCREEQRIRVSDFLYRYLPAIIGYKIRTEKHNHRYYHPRKSTFLNHLMDCFGWLI